MKMIRIKQTVTSVVMLLLACLVSLPFYYIVVNTFKTQAETSAAPLALPTQFSFDNYVDAFSNQPIVQSALNTAYVTIASTVMMLLIGSMAAYAIILRQSRRNGVIAVFLLIAFLVPFQVLLLPLHRTLVTVRLIDTLTGLVVVYLIGSVFCYFLILGYMRTVPREIIEAARVDGAGPFRVYWSVVLPLIRPILITVGVFQVMWVWNDFVIANVFTSSNDNRTLVLLVYSAVGEFTVNWPMFMTITVIALLPMVVFFVSLQRHIIAGLVAGSVKG